MKGKNIVIVILLLIAIASIAVNVYFCIQYKNASDEVEELKGEVTQLNEQINVKENEEIEPEIETEPEPEVVKEFKHVKYDPNKIVNSDSTYYEGCSVGNSRGNLSIKGNELTFSFENSATNYNYSVTYDAKEPIVDATRGTGGIGTFELTAIVTESGKVYTNSSQRDDGANELVEVQNLPKICRVVTTTSTSKDGRFEGGTVIAIDEEGNGYDLLKTGNN